MLRRPIPARRTNAANALDSPTLYCVAVHRADHARTRPHDWHGIRGRTKQHKVPGHQPPQPERQKPIHEPVASSDGSITDSRRDLPQRAGILGTWVAKTEPPYDQEGTPLWHEHPALGHRADVVALPLTDLEGVDVYPYDPWNPGPAIAWRVSHEVSIIGFPFGMSGGGRLAIWVRGTVATEPDIDSGTSRCSSSTAGHVPGSQVHP
jgi:hypothetical protein